MKELQLVLIGLFVLFLVAACTACEDTAKTQLSDYRPMLYVQDNLYGETSDIVNSLPDDAVYLGSIERVVSQSEPMIRKNFTSNVLGKGCEIYGDKATSDTVYVKLVNISAEQYSVYVIIE